MTTLTGEHTKYVCGLYRRFLKLAFDWSTERSRYRSLAVAIRHQFDQNRHETDPVKVALFIRQAEYLLDFYQHPEPYQYPQSPKGVNWEREERVPKEVCFTFVF